MDPGCDFTSNGGLQSPWGATGDIFGLWTFLKLLPFYNENILLPEHRYWQWICQRSDLYDLKTWSLWLRDMISMIYKQTESKKLIFYCVLQHLSSRPAVSLESGQPYMQKPSKKHGLSANPHCARRWQMPPRPLENPPGTLQWNTVWVNIWINLWKYRAYPGWFSI